MDLTAGLSPPTAPPQEERTRPVPPFISDVLLLLHILLIYARHLAFTLDNRALVLGFSTIASCFGTTRLSVIHARIARGLLRIQALQRVLLDRAMRGRDLKALKPRKPARRKPPQPVDPHAAPKPPRRRARRVRDLDDIPDPDNLPTLAQLEAEIRRRGIGRGIADICRDLGVSLCLCERDFGRALYSMLEWYQGNGNRLYLDFYRRTFAFDRDWDATPGLEVPSRTADGVRKMLGFLIGERWPRTPSWVAPCPGSLRHVEDTHPP